MDNLDLHKIDKDLAVLTALTEKHMEETSKDLKDLREAVSNMKIRVAGIAAAISVLIGGLSLFVRSIF